MDYFAGLDVSLEKTHICVLDRDGRVIHEANAPSSPDAITAAHSEVKKGAEVNGHRLDVLEDDNGGLWTGHAEHCLTDPEEEPDPSKWVTDLLFKTV